MSAAIEAEWRAVVDAVAAMNDPAELQANYQPDQVLQELASHLYNNNTNNNQNNEDGVKKIEAVCAALRGRDAAPLRHAEQFLFASQISTTEGFHVRPSVAPFTRRAARHGDDDEDAEAQAYPPQHAEDVVAYDADGEPIPSSQRRKKQNGKRLRGSAGGGILPPTSSHPSSRTSTPRTYLAPSARLASGFLDGATYHRLHREAHFAPVILLPSAVTAPLQLLNIKKFLEEGVYVDPTTLYIDAATGAPRRQDVKPSVVVVRPGSFVDRHKSRAKFSQFVCIDDPSLLTADLATPATNNKDDAGSYQSERQQFNPMSWQCVCSIFVQGNLWQLEPYFPARPTAARHPAELFQQVKGYLPYFAEDKVPPALAEWRVTAVRLTRSQLRVQQHLLEAFTVWEQLFEFLDLHPFFGQFTIAADE